MHVIFKHVKEWLAFTALLLLAVFVFLPAQGLGYLFYLVFSPVALVYPRYLRVYKRYSKRFSIAHDQLANTVFFGNPDQTISGRIGYRLYYLNDDNFIYVIMCKFLSKFFSQKHHCKEAIEFDRLD